MLNKNKIFDIQKEMIGTRRKVIRKEKQPKKDWREMTNKV